ncbi:hypothetical protein F4814DRAFT_238214 [Daldinia grandis]|nr:hypothetical protein F4814DRAFT_238214 [Daldinia grandis]
MSTQKAMKVANDNIPNPAKRRVMGHGTDAVVSGQASTAVAAKAAFGSTQLSNPLTSKPPKGHFQKKFQKKEFSKAFRKNGAPKKKLTSLETYGTTTLCAKGKAEPTVALAVEVDIALASLDNKSPHKPNDASHERVLEKFDNPSLNIDKKEFQDDMKKYSLKGLAASRWA